jgi:putative Ca2+/H+ antiporter (TMEM165/GDT1 family)
METKMIFVVSSFFEAFFPALFIIMAAEFGDKTHLIVLSLMSKTLKPYHVAFGGFIGITLVSLAGVIIGTLLGHSLPYLWISVLAGILFITLGILSLRDGESDEESNEDISYTNNNSNQVIGRSLVLVALAELGDKSQLFVITASAATNPYAIFLGSCLGMGIIFILTAIVGERLLNIIEPRTLGRISGYLFILAGLWLVISSFI